MATAADLARYSTVIDDLSTVAFSQLQALIGSLKDPNPVTFRDALLRTYPEMLAPFTTAATEVAADWYSFIRKGAGVTDPFSPVLASSPADEQLDALVRYSVSPLFAPADAPLGSTVFALLAGATQKLIANTGRDTIFTNTDRDPVRVGSSRIPQAGCCAFCAMLASRGAVYRSGQSAGAVVGRGVSASATAGKVGGQGKGVAARGEQGLGKKFHNHCHCVVLPVFPGDKLAIETRDKYKAIYDDAYQEADGTSTSAILSEIRKQQSVA